MSLQILHVEPFYSGSHRGWAERIQAFSDHHIQTLSLEGKNWKWRMLGGAPILARRYVQEGHRPDLILASSMLDLPTFLGAIARSVGMPPPVLLYAHEDQFLYPVPDERAVFKEQRKNFGAVNWRSALIADRVLFNSDFHRQEALKAYRAFVERAPDHRDPELFEELPAKSGVIPPMPDLRSLDEGDIGSDTSSSRKSILWNHRWEAEKGPERFADLLTTLKDEGYDLELILAGPSGKAENVRRYLQEKFPERIHRAELIPDRAEYLRCLDRADLLPVTSDQDFFGLSVVEAMYLRTVPILPDRLAYPEHLSDELRHCLFQDQEEALERLRSFLKKDPTPEKEEARRSVAPYDIRAWIESFDREIEAVAEARFS
ncbi:MAG: DUF3524 domain-containing protein [Flavobacteriales bacterium]